MRAVDDGVEGHRCHLGGLVAQLQQEVLPQVALADDLRVGEGRPQGHVGHEVERRLQARLGGVQPDGRGLEPREGAQRGAEVVHLLGDLERAAPTGALVEHAGGEGGQAGHVLGVARRPGAHQQAHVHDRDLVHLHHRELQAVRQRLHLHGRQAQRRQRPELRRPGAIGRIHGHRGGRAQHEQGAGGRQARATDGVRSHGFLPSLTASSVLPWGTTLSTTLCASARYCRATRCRSAGASFR